MSQSCHPAEPRPALPQCCDAPPPPRRTVLFSKDTANNVMTVPRPFNGTPMPAKRRDVNNSNNNTANKPRAIMTHRSVPGLGLPSPTSNGSTSAFSTFTIPPSKENSSMSAASRHAAIHFTPIKAQRRTSDDGSSSSIGSGSSEASTPKATKSAAKSTTKSTKKRTVFSVKKKAKAKLTPPRPRTASKAGRSISASSVSSVLAVRSAKKRKPATTTAKKAASTKSSVSSTNTAATGRESYVIRTSEHDPSPFQVELPTQEETLVHARLCHVMDTYMELGGVDFDLNDLVVGSNDDNANSDDKRSAAKKVMAALADVVPDIRVEGFFREYYDDCTQRVEAGIFRSHSLRQFIVCYRGGSAAQSRPLRANGGVGVGAMTNTIAPVDFHVKHPGATVHPIFKTAYLAGDFEEQIIHILNRLATLHPFCDVVMTGSSFGAAMATLGSMRYATLCPQLRVSATVFGSPKVGGEGFCQMVHSLPNLRVVRVELAERDVYTCLPDGPKWRHAGHSISIAPAVASSAFLLSTTLIETMVGGGLSSSSRSERSVDDDSSSSSDESSSSSSSGSRVVAYKFDHGKPGPSGFVAQSINELSRIMMLPATCLVGQGKAPCVASYIEQMQGLEDEWATDFSGLVGNGIKSLDNEVRLVV